MNRIDKLFSEKEQGILSVYMTAGFPGLNDTVQVLESLQESGADMVEIGIPFSDPLADGPVIQKSSQEALENGMSLALLFKQLSGIRNKVQIPLVMMGYLNPVLQYGMERFVKDCVSVGIDGLILPDLPMDIYQEEYRDLIEGAGLHFIMLVTPQTSEDRIKQIVDVSGGFLYMVADSSTTGARKDLKESQLEYFARVKQMKLSLPALIGFGISNRETFQQACEYSRGAIIGSAFIQAVGSGKGTLEQRIHAFVGPIIQ